MESKHLVQTLCGLGFAMGNSQVRRSQPTPIPTHTIPEKSQVQMKPAVPLVPMGLESFTPHKSNMHVKWCALCVMWGDGIALGGVLVNPRRSHSQPVTCSPLSPLLTSSSSSILAGAGGWLFGQFYGCARQYQRKHGHCCCHCHHHQSRWAACRLYVCTCISPSFVICLCLFACSFFHYPVTLMLSSLLYQTW